MEFWGTMRAMFLVVLCATIAVAVLVYMLLSSRPNSGKQQRLHPRLDISVPVDIQTNDEKHLAASKNISQGGMLLQGHAPVSISQPIRLRFTLSAELPVEIPAVVTYKKGEQIGVRFDPTHYRRADIEKWIKESNSDGKSEKPPESTASHTTKS
jgi:hypothetical protein